MRKNATNFGNNTPSWESAEDSVTSVEGSMTTRIGVQTVCKVQGEASKGVRPE